MNRSERGITRLPDGGLHLTAAAAVQLAARLAALAAAAGADSGGFGVLLERPQIAPRSESGDRLGCAEAAALLRVSPERVRQLCAAGRLPAHRDDRGAWRPLRADVIAYRDDRERRTA